MKNLLFLPAFAMLALALACCSSKKTEAPQLPGAPQTASATEKDSLPFPVYASFGQIAPLFHRQTDTTYVINFWATWCKPCVDELPWFEQLNEAFENQPVKILLVSLDFSKQISTKLLPFVQQHNLQAPVIALTDSDYNAWIDKVSAEWDGAIPFTLIYNQKMRKVKLGEMSGYDELEGLLKMVMRR